MRDKRYCVLMALFAIAAACVVLIGWQWLTGAQNPLLALCCLPMQAYAAESAQWLMIVARVVVVAGLFVGCIKLGLRLWKTYRLIVVTQAAVTTEVPACLTNLLGELDLSRHTLVVKTDVPVAFCFGQWRPRICISTGLVDALTHRELKAVLLHEDRHRLRRDPFRGLLAESAAMLLFFLPIAAELRDVFLTLMELDADRHAVRLAGRPALAGAMLKILSHPLVAKSVMGVAGVSRICPTEARIAQLTGDRTLRVHLSDYSLITSSAVIMLLCVAARLLSL